MTSHTNGTQSAISPDLFEILRDPQAIQEGGHGDDPGRLQLVRGSWLVSADTGYKYPIRDGIPVMLVEEGALERHTHRCIAGSTARGRARGRHTRG